jgi:hypothetical protein
VVDPVLVAGVGDPLFHQGLVSAIRELLIPMATVVTPNRMEAETLTGITINDQEDAQQACRILGQGGTAVFLKGGHMEGDRVLDLFFHEGEFLRLDYPRLERAGHGGGCTLASYIASHMALGYSLRESVTLSRRLIQRSIASMFSVGRGERLVDPTVRLQQHQEETGARLSLRRAWPLCTEDRMFLEDATQLHLLQTYGLFPILDDLVVLSGPLQEDCWQAEETDIAPAPLLDILRRCRDKDPTIKGAAMLRLPATGFQGWNGARAIGVDRLQRHLEDGASVPDLIYENQNDTTEVLLVAVGKDAPDALRRLRGTR